MKTLFFALFAAVSVFGQSADFNNQLAPNAFWMLSYDAVSASSTGTDAAGTGSVSAIPPTPPNAGTPGSVIATASPNLSCTVTGNAIPATAVIIACPQLGPTAKVAAYTMPMPAGTSYTFNQTYNGDAVTIMVISSATGAITWQAAATPSGGTAASGNGTL